ncbi:putative ribonuclease H-like domain-containing protein [Tanacetum coccineum]
MELENSQNNALAKLPMLKLGEYEMWEIRIKQYFQIQDYALWEVIENGNSWVPIPVTAPESGPSTALKMTVPSTAEEKICKKNDVKARSLLLMALPNEHQLTFKQLQKLVSRLAILGVVTPPEDLNVKFLRSLPSEWDTHVVVWMNKPDFDTMGLDDLYNNFKIVEQKVKKSTADNNDDKNLAFLTTSSPSSTNTINTVNTGVSTGTTKVNTASTETSTASFSDATVYAFLSTQPQGSQLVHEDLEQLHDDDLEEMDLKWNMALLSMRARKFYQRTGRKIIIDGSSTAGYDKSKVECFNCHKMGHFARECRAPRSKDNRNWNQGSSSKAVRIKDASEKAMCAIDGAGFDRSDMAEDEIQANMALMAFTDSEVSNDKSCSKSCLQNYEALKKQYDDLLVKLDDTAFKASTYKRGLSILEGQIIKYKESEVLFSEEIALLKRSVGHKEYLMGLLKTELEKVKEENEGFEFKIAKFEKSSKDLDQLLASQITDKSKKGFGYNVVPSPHPLILNRPTPLDLSYSGLQEFKQPESDNSKDNTNDSLKQQQKTNSSLVKSSIKVDKDWKEKFFCPANQVREEEPKKARENHDAPIIEIGQFKANDKGFVDSGCSRHMSGNIAHLSDFKDFDGGYVTFGGGANGGRITGKGTIKTDKLDFEDVYFVKELKFNLFSVSQMCDKKNYVLFTDSECLVLSPNFKLPDENQILLKIPRQDNMYSFDMKNIVPKDGLTCLVAKATSEESMLWHRRLGHVNFKNINKLVKENLLRELPLKRFENDQTCVACLKGKQHRASCKTKAFSPITKPLFMLHMDLFGPTFVSSLMHKKYCLVVTDDYSRFSWVFFLRSKDETSEILKNFIKEVENLVDKKVKIIRSDNGTEFKNKVMDEFCREKGIKREYSVARTPQQNGVAERKNRTLIEAARTMLADSKLPTTFWAEAVSTACYVQNRVLIVKPHNKTPYELFRGIKPAIGFMKPFGCHVTILNTLDKLGKFDGKSDEGFFVGYSLSSKAFRVYNIRTRKVQENLHIGFLENKPMIEGNGIQGVSESSTSSQQDQANQDCIVMPIWKDASYFDDASPRSVADAQIQDQNGLHDEIDVSEKTHDDSSLQNNGTADQQVNTARPEVNTGSREVSTAVPEVNTATPEDLVGPSPTSEDTQVEDQEIELGNIPPSYEVPTTPHTRIHKDHPIEHVIGDKKSFSRLLEIQHGLEAMLRRNFSVQTTKVGFCGIYLVIWPSDVHGLCFFYGFYGYYQMDVKVPSCMECKHYYGFASAPRALESSLELVPYHDSDYVRATQDRKSTTGGYLLTKGFDAGRFQYLVSSIGIQQRYWTSPEQTAPGKDFSNPLIVDSLLKTIWSSMHHVFYNEALASPKQMDLQLFMSRLSNKFWSVAEDTTDDNEEVKFIANIVWSRPWTINEASLRDIFERTNFQHHSELILYPLLATTVLTSYERPTKGYSGLVVALFPTYATMLLHLPISSKNHILQLQPSPEPSLHSSHEPSLHPHTEHSPSPSHSSEPLIEHSPDHTTAALILRVKKLEARVKIRKSRKRAKVVLSEDDDDVEDDSSKKGRKLSDAEEAVRTWVVLSLYAGATKEHGSERMKSPKKIEEDDIDTQKEVKEVAKESGAKRKKYLPRKKSTVKRQKMEIDDEKEDLKVYLDIVPRDDAAEDVESLSTKYPIVDWKTLCFVRRLCIVLSNLRGDGLFLENYKILSEDV